MTVKRRLNLEKSDLPLIEVEGNLELFKVWICWISEFNFVDVINTVLCREREQWPLPLKSSTAQIPS